MGLCGCSLKRSWSVQTVFTMKKNWHQIRISISGERQKICRIVAMKIRENSPCSGELGGFGGLCCRWNVCHQHLDMIDEMKNLPGAWIWKNMSLLYYSPFGGNLRSVVYHVSFMAAVENMSVQFVFWSLGPLSKTCLLQKRLPLSAVKAMVIFHERCDRWCLSSCG